jgi:hypothetical protein
LGLIERNGWLVECLSEQRQKKMCARAEVPEAALALMMAGEAEEVPALYVGGSERLRMAVRAVRAMRRMEEGVVVQEERPNAAGL